MSPQVSAVIATYNYAHYLPLAIRSCLEQTCQDLEIIVVDDGSKDNTPEVMQQFAGEPRVHYHRTPNAGQPAAENTGIRMAQGRYIAFLDADDLWLPRKIELQLKAFERTPEAGVVYGRRRLIDPDGHELQLVDNVPRRGQITAEMFRSNFVCFSSSMVRREVFDDVGMFNEEYRHASDYDFWLRVAPRWQFEYVDEPVVFYRTGHPNLTSRGDRQLLTALAIMDRFLAANPQVVPASVRRQCYAETYCHLALAYRGNDQRKALTSYLKAIGSSPTSYQAWRGLATLFLPESTRRVLRRVLGRPADWRVRQRMALAKQE